MVSHINHTVCVPGNQTHSFFIKVSVLSIREMMSGRLMPEGGAADAADITEGLRDGDELDFDGFVRAVSGAERRSTG